MADYAPVDLTAEGQVEFELNGRRVTAPAGTMLVDAAHAHGIEVPVFCYEPRLGPPVGACRMCLVEIEGMRGLQTACSTPGAARHGGAHQLGAGEGRPGRRARVPAREPPARLPGVRQGRRVPAPGPHLHVRPGAHALRRDQAPLPQAARPVVADRARPRALHLVLALRALQPGRGRGQAADHGGPRRAAPRSPPSPATQYEGRFTGNIIDICPVGALTSIPYRFTARPWDVSNTPSICGGCPAGCNVELTTREGHVARVTGRPEPNYAVEEGWICDRGRFSYPGDRAPERITTPVIRDEGRTRESSLDDAVAAAGLVLRTAAASGSWWARPPRWRRATSPRSWPPPSRARSSSGSASPARAWRRCARSPPPSWATSTRAGAVLIVGGDPPNQQSVVELRVRKAHRLGAQVLTVGLPPARPRGARHRHARPARRPRRGDRGARDPRGREPDRAVGRGRPGRRARRRGRARPPRGRARRPPDRARRRRQRRGAARPRPAGHRRARGRRRPARSTRS